MLQIPEQKFKQLLLTDGVVTEEQFTTAIQEGKRMNRGIASILLEEHLITEEYYQNLLAKFYGIERANFFQITIDEDILRLLPEATAREKGAIAFHREKDGTIDVAMLDPSDLIIIEFLTTRLHQKIRPFLASQNDLNRGFAVYSKRVTEDFEKTIKDNIVASDRARILEKNGEEAAQDIPIIALTDNLMSYAIVSRGSDIHLEVLEKEVLVRFRVDGVLREIMRLDKRVHVALVARFKLLAGLKLDEHNKAQDGRFRYKIGGDIMDLRVSTMPTFFGEKVEMRLLSAAERPLSFEELGFSPEHITLLRENIARSYGMILVTGPTGSGKTTTLYSVLNSLNKAEVNIVTVEDPIEYYMQYVNQTQVNPEAGITFANGLRAILRQDPNIIMVGEIRDEETAEISVNAALTGHLVLSSLHTNDTPTAIPRFIDLGVQPFLVSAVLNLVVAQRLVRRICLACIFSYKLFPDQIEGISRQFHTINPLIQFNVPKTMFKGKGCPVCNYTGFKGRIGIFEMLNVTEEIRNFMVDPSFTLDRFREIIRKQGFVSMLEDGLKKVERGMTTLEEILRVIRE